VGGVVSVGLLGAAGCGGGEATAPDLAMTGDCLKNGTKSLIAANHGHTITVTIAEIQAAMDKTYDIMGTASHTHSFTVTAADFAALAKGTSVTHTSSDSSGHTHSITISCA
jgi:hypothetical protein